MGERRLLESGSICGRWAHRPVSWLSYADLIDLAPVFAPVRRSVRLRPEAAPTARYITLQAAVTFALVVFGAIVGALSTGGASLYAERRDRRLKRKVAARLILGDLYLAEGGADEVLRVGHWANIEWGDPVETWRESREPFAASVDA